MVTESFASTEAVSREALGVLGVGRAVAKFTAGHVWIPSTVPGSTPPPYPDLCRATPSREKKWVRGPSAGTTGNRGEAEKWKRKRRRGKGGRADSEKLIRRSQSPLGSGREGEASAAENTRGRLIPRRARLLPAGLSTGSLGHSETLRGNRKETACQPRLGNASAEQR